MDNIYTYRMLLLLNVRYKNIPDDGCTSCYLNFMLTHFLFDCPRFLY